MLGQPTRVRHPHVVADSSRPKRPIASTQSFMHVRSGVANLARIRFDRHDGPPHRSRIGQYRLSPNPETSSLPPAALRRCKTLLREDLTDRTNRHRAAGEIGICFSSPFRLSLVAWFRRRRMQMCCNRLSGQREMCQVAFFSCIRSLAFHPSDAHPTRRSVSMPMR